MSLPPILKILTCDAISSIHKFHLAACPSSHPKKTRSLLFYWAIPVSWRAALITRVVMHTENTNQRSERGREGEGERGIGATLAASVRSFVCSHTFAK